MRGMLLNLPCPCFGHLSTRFETVKCSAGSGEGLNNTPSTKRGLSRGRPRESRVVRILSEYAICKDPAEEAGVENTTVLLRRVHVGLREALRLFSYVQF